MRTITLARTSFLWVTEQYRVRFDLVPVSIVPVKRRYLFLQVAKNSKDGGTSTRGG